VRTATLVLLVVITGCVTGCDGHESATRLPTAAPTSVPTTSTAAPTSSASPTSAPATSPPAPMPTQTSSASTDDRPIGSARMEPDGTLVLDLYAETPDGKSRGMAQLRKKPGEADYDKWLKHLGGMKPGEQKLVPPWPDE
jgi:hypothetical protein